MREFSAGWPQVEVTLQESADDRDLIALVERGELDLSFVVLPLDPGPYEVAELFRDPYVLVVPAGSQLASRDRPPSLRELLDHPLISNRTCRTNQRVEDRLRQAGREPHIAFRSDDNGTVQGLVAAGVGVASCPVSPSTRPTRRFTSSISATACRRAWSESPGTATGAAPVRRRRSSSCRRS